MSILVLEHNADEGAGTLGHVLEARHWSLERVTLHQGNPVPQQVLS